MKKFIGSRFLAAVVLMIMTFTTVNCGFLLYPERRDNMPGDIDGAVLVMDCLWLLVGIVPGVAALVIDFTTGSIYFGGHGKGKRYHEMRRYHEIRIDSLRVHPGDKIGFNLSGSSPSDAEIDITLARSADKNTAVTLFDRKYAKGVESKNFVILTLPQQLSQGEYNISVKVNGIESNSLDLEVTI